MLLTHEPRIEVAQLLIGAGAEVNAVWRPGETVIDYIARDHRGLASRRVRRRELVEFLRRQGARTGTEPEVQSDTAKEHLSRQSTEDDPDLPTTTIEEEEFAKLRQMETNGANYDLDTEDIIAHLKAWQSLCSFRIVDAKHDTVVVEFESLPADLDAFVRELYEFCPDLVDQGAECLPDLIDEQVKKGRPVPAELESLVEGVDFQNEDFGLEILKRQLQQQPKLTLWWD
jgi:hypothetical protein